MTVFYSPAKVNLFLRVQRKREDGYHDLASLFQAVDLKDAMYFHHAHEDRLSCSDPLLPVDGSNLVVKALQLFRKKTGISTCFSIHLEKRVPMQAGLGGGSSNAATTLYALNELCGRPATQTELQAWAGAIGSDVPFFFSEGTALCEGRGEILYPLPPLDEPSIYLVKPVEGISTARVFSHVKVSAQFKCDPKEALSGFYTKRPSYFNDLEEAAFSLLPSLASLKQQLIESGFDHVVMTGSGTAFLCIGKGELPKACFCHTLRFVRRSKEQWY